jgi:hypothetical protein
MPAMLAQGVLALSLVVRIYDAYGVPADHLASAQAAAEGIMKAAGVAVIWPQCPCLSPVRREELVVRVTGASPASTPGSLGFSFVDIGQKAGTLATVFADRVHSLAAIAGVDEGELLGRVIAHELSHLLIGTRDHGQGLMRGEWRASELVLQRPSDWLLSRAEGYRIRQALRRRAPESEPTMITVDADPVPAESIQ